MSTNTINSDLKQTAINWFREFKEGGISELKERYGYTSLILTPSDIIDIYLKEHLTEAEVSKEEETVEQACVKESKDYGDNMKVHIECAFINGAAWQKEKDRELISELLDGINLLKGYSINNPKINALITKAEKHLNETNQTAKSMETTDKAETHASEVK